MPIFLSQVPAPPTMQMPDPSASSDAWMLWMLVSAIGALTSALAFLWRQLESSKSDLLSRQEAVAQSYETRWQQCEEQHKESLAMVVDLTGKVSRIEGRYDLLEALHKETLKQVHGSDNETNGHPPSS